MANVKARIALKARVCVINSTSGPKEGAQWHNMHNCVTGTISDSEWRWRWAAAVDILCGGSTDYTSYGDAIGDGWV
jgi:hypothetical protein